NILSSREQVAGLQVLTIEGLNNQYMNNLSFESKVRDSSTNVMKRLLGTAEIRLSDEELALPQEEQEKLIQERGREQKRFVARIASELDKWMETDDKSMFTASQELIDL